MRSPTTSLSSAAALAAAAVILAPRDACAFAPPQSTSVATTATTTSLSAMPPLIIGPMIRRMRENNAKKNAPMANPDEAKSEAPGLRVGANAWKWPPVWPYDSNFFKRKSEMGSKGGQSPLANPMGMMGGGANGMMGGAAAGGGENGTDVKGAEFDSLKFWEENGDVSTDLDPRVVEKITK